MLLEALIAVLIFSMGILAIVGMQASAVRATSDAKYRSDASIVANKLIGEMWVSDRSATALQTKFQGDNGTGGPAYISWLDDVNTLPGAAANPPTVKVVTVAPVLAADPILGQVTITIRWNLPGDEPHNYKVIAQIN
jgi:type IV pilus assembly protein PilV